MADEIRDATPEEVANEEAIKHFEAEAAFRQSNVLPLESAMNEGRFYGLLVGKSRPLGVAQRLGFLFIGITLSGSAFLAICFLFPSEFPAFALLQPEPTAVSAYRIVWLPYSVILLAGGVWLILKALWPFRRRVE